METNPLATFPLLLLAAVISAVISSPAAAASTLDGFSIWDGKVLELDESNFDAAISKFDFVFVDFYAPWCGHCKRLSPELDAAAKVLASLKEPIVIAKVDADKYSKLAIKHDIDGFPTLKIFANGVPTDYYGPRKSDLLVRYLKKFVAPDVALLDSDSAVSEFVESAGTHFPIYIGFGLDEAVILDYAKKYKKKAWFAVAKDFSEDVMVSYDFDKVPSLVALHPTYDEKNIFYGPFEENFVEDFVKQNFLPAIVPINRDTLKVLTDDDRNIVLTIVEDEGEDLSKKLFKLLKAAAYANRDLIFAYVGINQFGEFADSFGGTGKNELPKMIVWDGNEQYLTVVGSERIDTDVEDPETQISGFIKGYREGSTEQKRIGGPSFMKYVNSLIGIRTVYILVFLVCMLMLIRSISKEEPLRVGTREESEGSPSSEQEETEYKPGDKED
ncbi:hypothetical protein MLD38_001108 [Melastoma candidum]|uniref:Uncharacterized protein n=1 Tax=Melastoma candidum TaxID=119954 RepID=A0ACB9SC70_9MYRT|nr:hypothetical protein MLD38_001108 [Melastoma candidum]